MSENTTETGANASENTNDDAAQQSQEIDWKQESRKWEERAKANIAPEKHQEALAELQGQVEAAKEEIAALAETKTALETAQADLIRYKLALKHNLDEEDVELFLVGNDEETLEKQAQRISERNNSANALRPDPAQGRRTATGTPSTIETFSEFMKDQIQI